MEDIYKDTRFGRIALKKLSPVGENFMLFECGWLNGDRKGVMECKGATFREAKSGPNKGKLTVIVPGTTRIAYVTREEILDADRGVRTVSS